MVKLTRKTSGDFWLANIWPVDVLVVYIIQRAAVKYEFAHQDYYWTI